MKKILTILMSLFILTATAYAEETAPTTESGPSQTSEHILCFVTNDGLVPLADYEATFHYLVENNSVFDGTEEKPLSDNNTERMHQLSQYTDANHLAISYGWNKKENYLTISIAQAEHEYNPQIVLQHLQAINHIFVSTIDPKSKEGPDGIMKKNGVVTLVFVAGKSEPVGVWRHGMKVDKEKQVYLDSSYMVLAMASPIQNEATIQDASVNEQAE